MGLNQKKVSDKHFHVFPNGKRGQVTIFVIVAIIIVVVLFSIFLLFPKIKTSFSFEENNPSSYIQSCIEEEMMEGLDLVSAQGGSLDPEHYLLYNEEKLEYLCYTNEYYERCVMQQPLLKQHVESELTDYIASISDECFEDLKETYESKDYNVALDKGDYYVELLPNRVQVVYNYSLTLDKNDVKKYDQITVSYKNNIYELVSIAMSILNFEAHYGDSETTLYMSYYRDLKVEKKKQTDGSTVYLLTELDTGNKFNFASRSLAWPPGYA